jgi:hypothetical protein
MKSIPWYRLAGLVAVVSIAGCKSLEVTNPNAPDAKRAFSDPGAVAGLVTGAMRNWVLTRESIDGSLPLDGMADSYSASWNNWNLRYYTSYNSDCTERCGWANSPSDPHRFEIETLYYGYYSLLSSVNDVLTAIRKNGVDLGGAQATRMHEAVAVMLQAVVFANIALDYDQGFVVTENTDLSSPQALPFVSRTVMRDSALAKFNQAIALMQANAFTTPGTWLLGPSYTSAQLIQLIHTMRAELLADFARNSAEVGEGNWAQVATDASQGISSGTPFDFTFQSDFSVLVDGVKAWGNQNGTMRVDTRVARLVTGGYPDALGTGPVYRDPYPNVPEPQPFSKDRRVGDGSWGPENDVTGQSSVAATANAGTDYAWFPHEIMNPSRGTYHRSSLGHIRYTYLASPGSGLPTENGNGPAPVYTQAQNDLLWAEGLLRGGGSAAQAATLINKTRVGRGGLTPLTGAEGQATLLTALQYEQEIEEMGLGPVPFHNRRRATPEGGGASLANLRACSGGILCLWTGTPRQMPVPAKELSVLQKELYTFGGVGQPDMSPSYVGGEAVFNVRQIGEAIQRAEREARRRKQ